MRLFIVSILSQLAQVLGPLIWKWLSDGAKDKIAKNHISDAIDNALKEYDSVIEEQKVLAIDGLTEEEKNVIREKKSKIRADIINARG